VKDYLRRLGVALMQCIAILVVLSTLYVAGYVAVHQRLPRWK
jgi:hypothetical protein